MPSPRSQNCIPLAAYAIQIFLESKFSITSCILPVETELELELPADLDLEEQVDKNTGNSARNKSKQGSHEEEPPKKKVEILC